MSETLGLDFINYGEFMGNIGFLFDDLLPQPTFTFYVLKAKDVNGKRLFRKVELLKHAELSFIEKNINHLLKEAMDTYSNISETDLAESNSIL